MHTTFLALVPKDPDFVPTADRIERARETFRAALPAVCGFSPNEYVAEVEPTRVWPTIQLSVGLNSTDARCPQCGGVLTIEWLFDELKKNGELRSSADLCATAPCCRAQLRLHELEHPAPEIANAFTVGFGRFSFMADAPMFSTSISAAAWTDVEAVVGCELKTVIVAF